jgi:hypothetical protein
VSPHPPRLALLLAILLVIVEPLGLAYTASSALPRLALYGPPAFLLLACRVLVAGLGIAAGRALWTGDAAGPRLARWWAAAHALALVLTFATPFFPSNRVPGTKGPTLAFLLALDAGWWAWLRWSPAVRRAYAGGAARNHASTRPADFD